jgi:hypothetical protein
MGTIRRAAKRDELSWVRLWDRALAVIREPGALANLGLRLAILVLTVDAIVNAGDPRFAGKALGPRNVGILLGLSMLFPILHLVYKRWKRYPVWYDDLYLSVFSLDMAGNSLNLYSSVEWWDHVPHFHGPGALSMVLIGAFGLAPLAAAGFATMLHVLLEVNEYYGDVMLGTHNVRGIADSMNDLSFGLAGVLVYTIVAKRSMFLRLRRTRPKRKG